MTECQALWYCQDAFCDFRAINMQRWVHDWERSAQGPRDEGARCDGLSVPRISAPLKDEVFAFGETGAFTEVEFVIQNDLWAAHGLYECGICGEILDCGGFCTGDCPGLERIQ